MIDLRLKILFRLIFVGWLGFFGLSGCQRENESTKGPAAEVFPAQPAPPEIKIEALKLDVQKHNQSILPQHSRDWDNLLASDTLQFKIKTQTNSSPVKLFWTTACLINQKKLAHQGVYILPADVKTSELLPSQFFFDLDNGYRKDVYCSFEFVAKQEATGASHTFTYQTPVYFDHEGGIRILHPATNQPIEDLSDYEIVNEEFLAKGLVQFSEKQYLELRCTHFQSQLIVEQNKALVRKEPFWLDEASETHFPAQEFPLQVCRIIGKRDSLIASWSPYFILKTQRKDLSFSWTSAPTANQYVLNRPFPSIDPGHLTIKNNSPKAPQIMQIPKSADFDIYPLCDDRSKMRPPNFVRNIPADISPHPDFKFLADNGNSWTIKLAPLGTLDVTYQSPIPLSCPCIHPVMNSPVSYAHAKMLDREAGYFIRHHGPNSPIIQLLVENPTHPGTLMEISSWQKSAPNPLAWVHAARPPEAADYTVRVGREDKLQLPFSSPCK